MEPEKGSLEGLSILVGALQVSCLLLLEGKRFLPTRAHALTLHRFLATSSPLGNYAQGFAQTAKPQG